MQVGQRGLAGSGRIPPRSFAADDHPGIWSVDFSSRTRRVLLAARAARIALLALLWTLLAAIPQTVLILLPGRGKKILARLYWRGMCAALDLRVRMVGQAPGIAALGRPIVYVSNHSSWLDILVLGGRLEACFISKTDVARWPGINVVAWLGRTAFVDRQRGSTRRERDSLRERLAGGDNLILFPEGTTSDGSRVLSFRSAFFSIAEQPVTDAGALPLIQPVSVVYDRMASLPTGRAGRSIFAWYGDMGFAPHFWRLAQQSGLRATVLLHPPLEPAAFASRKELARAVWEIVANGAATLRQNRFV
jgi:1-acyl-sn-glycerol-3-phosphate acyltransferase